jgi:triacylglycerol lipase
MIVPALKAPLVLVHGLFGFNRIQVSDFTIADYFPGVVPCLRDAGNRVLVPSLSPTGGVAQRAQQLREFILRETSEPVHILAHSMGGLDARYMISKLDMAPRVLSLTTLGTPHKGTCFADWGLSRLEGIVKPALDFFGVPYQAFYDLTTASCSKFNAEVPNAANVRYFSVAGRHDGGLLTPEWLLSYFIVLNGEGPNDGVVSVTSAQFGEGLEIWDGDHFSLVNWVHPLATNRTIFRDPAPRYGSLLRRLANEGY